MEWKTCTMLTVAGLALLFAGSAAVADLNPGGTLDNPDFVNGNPDWSPSDSIPSWYTGTPVDSLTASMNYPSGDFIGTAISEVYYLNGTDVSGGLGFVYQFLIDQAYTGQSGLKRAAFDGAGGWGAVTVYDVGADGSGSSTSLPTGWSDGDPAYIEREFPSGAPIIQWASGSQGTALLGGDSSSLIWLETNAQNWTVSFTSLQDGGDVGKVAVLSVPTPAAVGLGWLGLGLVFWRRRSK